MSTDLEDLLGEFDEPQEAQSGSEEKSAILIIDDDESIRRGIKNALSSKYRVVTAETGRQGLELLSDEIHCVVLDVKMQELSGFQTYPKLKNKNPDIPIIFFTAYQSEHDLKQVVNEFKPEGYVDKGGDYPTLSSLIERAVLSYKAVKMEKEKVKSLEQELVRIRVSKQIKPSSGGIPWV